MPYKRIVSYLRRRRLGAFLIARPENRRYVSGYTALDHDIAESSGALLITAAGDRFLLTDFRYREQAEKEAPSFNILTHSRGMTGRLFSLLAARGVRSLAFESDYTLFSHYEKMRREAAAAGVSLHPLTGVVERLRAVKTDAEIKAIAKAVALNERVFQQILPRIEPGRSEREIALLIENTMRALGAERPSFDTIVASGPNAALPHATPGERRLREGEPIVIDMGLVLDGYCSDMTRTIVLGGMDERCRRVFRLVRAAQKAAIKEIAPGRLCREIDAIARNVITEAGHGRHFGHGLGHGVGLAVHESPSLSPRCRKKLRAGMVVTVEPGIYIEGWGGVRLENMVAVTSAGCDILNKDTTFLDL